MRRKHKTGRHHRSPAAPLNRPQLSLDEEIRRLLQPIDRVAPPPGSEPAGDSHVHRAEQARQNHSKQPRHPSAIKGAQAGIQTTGVVNGYLSHDDDCRRPDGGPCTCQPDLEIFTPKRGHQ